MEQRTEADSALVTNQKSLFLCGKVCTSQSVFSSVQVRLPPAG